MTEESFVRRHFCAFLDRPVASSDWYFNNKCPIWHGKIVKNVITTLCNTSETFSIYGANSIETVTDEFVLLLWDSLHEIFYVLSEFFQAILILTHRVPRWIRVRASSGSILKPPHAVVYGVRLLNILLV